MIRAIFFDFDGVLVDSEPLHFRCWAEVLAEYGMSLESDQYVAHFIGVSNQQMVEILCQEAGRRFSRAFFDECYNKKKVLYQAQALRCRTPNDLGRFILTSSKTYKLGVVSSSSRCEVEPHLIGQGLRDAIAALVCQEDVQNLKPAPDPYRRALEIVNNGAAPPIEPQDCLVVEDSGPGAEAGRKAGMRVLLVPGPSDVFALLAAELAGQ